MENLRDQRQREFADIWMKYKFGTLLISPRMGKTRIAIFALQQLNNPSVLIAYPEKNIKKSWTDEFEIVNYDESNVTFTTHVSLHKHKEQKFDVVILDEIHLLSEAQIIACQELLKLNRCILGLTGTLAKSTRALLMMSLSLRVIAEYSIEQAIAEGVIADYEITVVTVPLDNRIIRQFGKKAVTEKTRFDNLSYIIDQLEVDCKNTMFLRLARMRVIQGSIAKINKTKQLLKEYQDQRVLVFTGLTKVAESLGIPSHHSKSIDKGAFKDFAEGDIQHLAVCKIGSSGITFKPLNRVIINYTDSNPELLTQKINRCTSMEYDNPEKRALITIVSTNEEVELNWIKKGLAFFEKSKIKYL